MKSKEYPVFPIHNTAACVYKWGWGTVKLYTGEAASCHRVDPVKLSIDDFANFHNNQTVINDRKLMADGIWPKRGCEYCEDVEAVGGVSDRTYHNAIPGLTPVDFTMDPTAPVTPSILEVYLHNTCDLACVYCSPKLSSKINAELEKFGPNVLGIGYIKQVDDRDLYYQKFVEWLDTNAHKVSRLSVMGGEPFLQKDFWRLLDKFSEQNNPNLEVSINTNLNCAPEVMDRFIKISYNLLSQKRLKAVSVNCSLDCLGEAATFVRYGINLDNWKRNFETLIQHKWFKITVQQVMTSLTLPGAIDLQKQIAEYKLVNDKIGQAYHLVDGSTKPLYHPEIFGAGFFDADLDLLLATYPITNPWDVEAKSRLEGISKLLKASKPDVKRLQLLKQTLDQIDQRRGTDWKTIFPKINNFFIENKI
jgi:organic radical activating enzyme